MRVTIPLPLAGLLPATSINAAESDRGPLEEETLHQFKGLLWLDATDQPGREKDVAKHLVGALRAEGLTFETVTLKSRRPSVVTPRERQ